MPDVNKRRNRYANVIGQNTNCFSTRTRLFKLYYIIIHMFASLVTFKDVQTPSPLRPISFQTLSRIPHKIIKYMIWSIAASAAKRLL
jgi:hypothetical protein